MEVLGDAVKRMHSCSKSTASLRWDDWSGLKGVRGVEGYGPARKRPLSQAAGRIAARWFAGSLFIRRFRSFFLFVEALARRNDSIVHGEIRSSYGITVSELDRFVTQVEQRGTEFHLE